MINTGEELFNITFKYPAGLSKVWHDFLIHLPRHTKYTVGSKIDSLIIECVELTLLAGYAPKEQKPAIIQKLSAKFDAVKFFLKLLREIKGINDQKYLSLSQQLAQVGKMIGGWQNLFKSKPPL